MITTNNPYEQDCMDCKLPFSAHTEKGTCPVVPDAVSLVLFASENQLPFGCKVRTPKVGFDA